jgi:hypothetical protein
MSKRHHTPYVSVELIRGRLARVCPECRQEIGEHTDDDGIVSNNFAEHYESAHREQEPERQRCYLLGFQPREDGEPDHGPNVRADLSRKALRWVRKQIPDVEWELVHRVEDLPEGAPTLQAAQVIAGSWPTKDDDPQRRKIRWYRREEDRFVFAPTTAQLDDWEAVRSRANNARDALIERHRGELPDFAGKSFEEWKDFYPELKKRENEIAKDFDAQRAAASNQFFRGDHRWQATLEAAIADLGIPDDEVEELRASIMPPA